jgi:IS5 family transposase
MSAESFFLLDGDSDNRSIWADSAYRSAAREEQLRDQGYNSRIHRKGTKQRALNQREQETNHRRSKTRAQVDYQHGSF